MKIKAVLDQLLLDLTSNNNTKRSIEQLKSAIQSSEQINLIVLYILNNEDSLDYFCNQALFYASRSISKYADIRLAALIKKILRTHDK